MVFFYHWLFNDPQEWPFVPRALAHQGYLGVTLFFALSGFLIYNRYGAAFGGRAPGGAGPADTPSVPVYLFKRFARIYPLYFFVLTFFVMALGRPESVVPRDALSIASNYTLTQAYFPDAAFKGTFTAWSLTIEETFYLLAPLLIGVLARSSSWHHVWKAAVLATAAGAGLALLLSALPPGSPATIIGAPLNFLLQNTILGRIADFLLGMLAARAFQSRAAWLAPHARQLVLGGALGLLAMIFITEALAAQDGPANRALGALTAGCVSVLLLGLASDEHGGAPGALTRFLGSPAIVYAGRISYALYLIQLTEPVQYAYWVITGAIQHRIAHALVIYAIATALSALLFHTIEQPAQRLLTRGLPAHG